MDYDLVHDLKKAGFPLRHVRHAGPRPQDEPFVLIDGQWFITPSLSELIESCLALHADWWFESHRNGISGKWIARLSEYPSNNGHPGSKVFEEAGDTFEEAAARLWFVLDRLAPYGR
jgi:hypothetical protein